jgi:hypothetical protein
LAIRRGKAMISHRHYYPILKGKKGEFMAVSHLPSEIRANLTPFFDIPRPENEKGGHVDTYLVKKVESICKSCGSVGTLFIDFFDFDLALRTSSGRHFVRFSFDKLRNCSVEAIPVTGLDRDDEYNIAVAQTISVDRRGVAIRLQKEDIEDPSSTKASLGNLLEGLKVKENNVHLFLDIRDMRPEDLDQNVDDVVKFLADFGDLRIWKTLILSASGFPENMGGVRRHSLQLIPRTELVLWEQVLSECKKKKLNRLPAFSDYCICHPDILDFDRSMNPSANIRYTLSKNWLIVKGGGLKQKIGGRTSYDYDQFFVLAERLRLHRNYRGPGFSNGDLYIQNCKKGTKGPGNLPKWREVGTNHHLTLVAEQIANFHVA